MRRIALASGFVALLALTAAGAVFAAETERPAARAQPKPDKSPKYGSSGAGSYGTSRPAAARPESRKRPALESMANDRPYGYGRSGYDGGHGRSGEGEGWLGWRSWGRR